jgi:hypothetical protein
LDQTGGFLEFFLINLLTKVYNDDKTSPMRILRNIQGGDTAFVYAGLGQISGKGRKTLKHIAQSLVWAQNNPGYPLPEGLGQQIKRELGTPDEGSGDSSGESELR